MPITWLMLAACGSACHSAPTPVGHFALTENLGQWETPARFVGELGDTLVRVEPQAIWLHKAGTSDRNGGNLLKLSFEGASDKATVEGRLMTPTLHSYFIGNDPARWVHAARSYAEVKLSGIYPGIDLVLGERNGVLEYDVHVAAGADLSQFVVRCEGAEELCIDQDGELRIETGAAPLLHGIGASWEIRVGGSKRHVLPRWQLVDGQRFRLVLDDRDPHAELVIDPDLAWATYLGSNSVDEAVAAVAAPDGTVVIAGGTSELSFPTTPGSVVIGPPADKNLFVTKISADGSALVYSCIIGGLGSDVPKGISLDALGRTYVVGFTQSLDFPTTSGVLGPAYSGQYFTDGMALRLSTYGDALEYSTYLGTTQGDMINACVVTASGALIVAGLTGSSVFPTTPNAYQGAFHGDSDAFVSRISPDASNLEWSTYLGGTRGENAYAVALGDNEDVLVTGLTDSVNYPTTPGTLEPTWQGVTSDSKTFVTRLNASASSLVWSTFFGGPGASLNGTVANSIATIPSGDVFLAGFTTENSFPTTPGAYQTTYHYNAQIGNPAEGFVTRLKADASALVYSTYLGTEYGEIVVGMSVDGSGVATVASRCVTLPTTPGCYQPAVSINDNMGVSRFNPSGSRLIYSTLLGGPFYEYADGITLTPEGRVTVVGYGTTAFPTTAGSLSPTYNGGQFDGIVGTLDLFPSGVSRIGSSTPACHGPLILQTSEVPQSGSTTFSVLCSNAPPNAPGWLILGRKTLAQSVQFAGSALWIAPPDRLMRLSVFSDACGFVEIPIPLAIIPSGGRVAVQVVFRTTPQCTGPGATCASPALEIQVQ